MDPSTDNRDARSMQMFLAGWLAGGLQKFVNEYAQDSSSVETIKDANGDYTGSAIVHLASGINLSVHVNVAQTIEED